MLSLIIVTCLLLLAAYVGWFYLHPEYPGAHTWYKAAVTVVITIAFLRVMLLREEAPAITVIITLLGFIVATIFASTSHLMLCRWYKVKGFEVTDHLTSARE